MNEEWVNREGRIVVVRRRRWWQIWKPRFEESEPDWTNGVPLRSFLKEMPVSDVTFRSKFSKTVTGTFGQGDPDE
jgi:hypothetical protein